MRVLVLSCCNLTIRTDWNIACVKHRGPEIEHCIGDEGTDPATENDWSLLPFMALSDGAHLYETLIERQRFLPKPAPSFRSLPPP